MPTYDKAATFLRDWAALRPDQRLLFLEAVAKSVTRPLARYKLLFMRLAIVCA